MGVAVDSNLLLAFGLTAFAGLATGIGSAIALLARRTSKEFLSLALGFSGGVMVYVSFVEIFAKSRDALTESYGEVAGTWATVAAFFGGMLFIAVIDRIIPSEKNPHEPQKVENLEEDPQDHKLMRMGLFTALAIAIHNFPEGFATFASAMADPKLGVAVAVAIAIHNIPEGISVSVPIYYATGSRKKAFWLSFASGVSEPIGALVGYALLMQVMSPAVFGITFGAVAGIMVFISLDELLPTAREYSAGHYSVYGMIAGMAVMALSLLLFL